MSVVSIIPLLLSHHHRLVHLGFKNCSEQRLEIIVFCNLQNLEVLICYVKKLAKPLAIVIYQDGTDVSLVYQSWPVVAVLKTAYSLTVIVSCPGYPFYDVKCQSIFQCIPQICKLYCFR